MGTVKTIFLFLLLVCCWCGVAGQPVLEQYPVFQHTLELREKVIRLAESQLYVREKTGHNDGREVETYLHSVGLHRGDAWCAAFISWVHSEFDIPNPESGYSPNWFHANLVYLSNKPRITPFVSRPAQVFGLYYENKGRIAHVGLIISEDRLHYLTIEGNTNNAGSNEGDGVYRKIRRKESIYAISDFAGWKEILSTIRKNEKN